MYNGKKVSVVMPAYNEEKAIKNVISSFKKDFVDEIVVADNNSTDHTAKIAAEAGAFVVREKKQGQGFAMKKALKSAKGDIIFIIESDGTFDGADMKRFLDIAHGYDAVFGSRITKENRKTGALNWYTCFGNLALSFTLKMKYGVEDWSDVGCTFKLFKRESLDKIVGNLKLGGGDACVEHVILSLKSKQKITQIPVKYNARIGETKQSHTIFHSIIVGAKHLKHILAM